MRRTPASMTSGVLGVLLATLSITSCGHPSDDPASNITKTSSAPAAWKPAGAEPVVVLKSPGDGGERKIHVGDRVRLPRTKDAGGLRLDDWRGLLVPYGGNGTYLAVGPGRVPAEDTVYDHEQPCVPPQPVASFDLVIDPGPRPALPPSRHLAPKDDGRTATVVPGQELTYPRGWSLRDDSNMSSVVAIDGQDGTYAVRPGTTDLTLTRDRPTSGGRVISHSIRVRVIAPRPAGSQSSPSPAATNQPTGAPGDTAAGPAPRPACA